MRKVPHAPVPAVLLGTLALAVAIASSATGMTRGRRGGLCATIAARHGGRAYLAVLSAFPAELAPLIARAVVRKKVEVGERAFYVGELAGVRVVLGLMGIGMVNAATTTTSLLRRFRIAGVVVSGVAGSSLLIGDVLVPERWLERDTGSVFSANRVLFELAGQVVGDVALERCTAVPPPSGPTVCITSQPSILVGGLGRSGDPFGGKAFPCRTGEIFGCDLPAPATRAKPQQGGTPEEEPVADDMETAAMAGVATRHRVPWVAFRAVSDGAGDPLGLPGFPAQFFAYYRLAAGNAAAGTLALLDRIAHLDERPHPRHRLCHLLARARWERAAQLLQTPAM